METPTTTNARDAALASVPTEKREMLLRKASDLGVHGSDDVIWALVASVVDATAAAQAAGEAAANVRTAVAGMQQQVYDGAAKASADVKAVLEASITGTVHASVAAAAQAGADALRQAAADLPKVARQEQDRIVQEWKAALASAAREHAFAGFLQKLSVNIAVLAVLVGAIFVGGLAAGGGGMEAIIRAQHRLVPAGWVLEVGTDAKPLCGPLAGRYVCLVRKAPRP